MSPSKNRIAVIPGDGIGPEVIREAVRVLERVRETHGVELELTNFDWGAEKFLRDGVSLPAGALAMLSSEFDAILAFLPINMPKIFFWECDAVLTSTSICGRFAYSIRA